MSEPRLNLAGLRALMTGDVENFIVASTPGGIEAQKARGQAQFVNSATLPIECSYCTREQFEAIGIVYGESVDDLFVNVTLPAGWRKERTDHLMWSKLLDERGRERASIFYKAAFYDRNAWIGIARAINPTDHYCDADGNASNDPTHVECRVVGPDGTILHAEPRVVYDDWVNRDAASERAHAWANEHYPQWRDPLAYWD